VIGVLIALEAEARAILADPRFGWERRGERSWHSLLFPLRLELSGVGKAFASWTAAALAPDCELVLSIGTSGGLASERVGSLWLVKEFVEHDMNVTGLGLERGVTPFAGMEGPVISRLSAATEAQAVAAHAAVAASAGAASAPGAGVFARSASGDRFIGDPSEACALREATGASLCDMESAAVAKLCVYRSKAEVLGLRSVSDNADHGAHLSWESQVELSARDFDTWLHAFVSARP